MGSNIENKISSIEIKSTNNNIESVPVVTNTPEQKTVSDKIAVENNILPPTPTPKTILPNNNPIASSPTQKINNDDAEMEIKNLYLSNGSPCELTNDLSALYKKIKKID